MLNALKARGALRFHLLTVMEAQDEKLRPDDPPRSQTMLLERQVRWAGSARVHESSRARIIAVGQMPRVVTLSYISTRKAWTPTIRHPAARHRLLVACMIAGEPVRQQL